MIKTQVASGSRGLYLRMAAVVTLIAILMAGQIPSVRALPAASPDGYEVDNTPAQANSITPGTPQTHSISPANDIDWVKFHLSATSSVSIETMPTDPNDTSFRDTRMWLYDSTVLSDPDPNLSNTTPIAFNDDKQPGTWWSYIQQCGGNALPAGDYYVKVDEYLNDNEIPSYNIAVNIITQCISQVGVDIGGSSVGSYYLPPATSIRQSYQGVNNGAVEVHSLDGTTKLIAAERVILTGNGQRLSYSELMGLPNKQIDFTYWMPWYDNVNMDTALRFGNVSGSTAHVNVYIHGDLMPGSPFTILQGQSTRISFYGVNNGPVKITSDTAIVAAERLLYAPYGTRTSFSEIMGMPDGQLDTTYWFPWYNNVELATTLRVSNVSSSDAQVSVYIHGSPMPGSPFGLPHGSSTLLNYPGINDGVVKIVSNFPIVASERVLFSMAGRSLSLTEMMGLPDNQVESTYWMPWYNNVDLDSALRFGNVSGSTAHVDVYIHGNRMTGSPFTLGVGQSTRISFAGINDGVVKIVSDFPIVAAERVIFAPYGSRTSFSELMGLPNAQLDTSYWLPWYNNVELDTALRFGLP